VAAELLQVFGGEDVGRGAEALPEQLFDHNYNILN
jgi:hypothetical protein